MTIQEAIRQALLHKQPAIRTQRIVRETIGHQESWIYLHSWDDGKHTIFCYINFQGFYIPISMQVEDVLGDDWEVKND